MGQATCDLKLLLSDSCSMTYVKWADSEQYLSSRCPLHMEHTAVADINYCPCWEHLKSFQQLEQLYGPHGHGFQRHWLQAGLLYIHSLFWERLNTLQVLSLRSYCPVMQMFLRQLKLQTKPPQDFSPPWKLGVQWESHKVLKHNSNVSTLKPKSWIV